MFEQQPMTMSLTSPRSTALHQTEESAPMRTLPITWADAWT
jgi:hypothetical protein